MYSGNHSNFIPRHHFIFSCHYSCLNNRVNFLQSVNLVHFLLPSLTEARGHIVAVSSGASMVGMPQVAAYRSVLD